MVDGWISRVDTVRVGKLQIIERKPLQTTHKFKKKMESREVRVGNIEDRVEKKNICLLGIPDMQQNRMETI